MMKTMTITACQMIWHRFTVANASLVALLFWTGIGDVTKAEEKFAGPQITLRVQVRNSDGDPVVGAVVRPNGLRSRVEPSSHYGWINSRHGKITLVKTDEHGIAEVLCPKFVIEKLETGQISWQVDHEDYILFQEDRSVDDAPAEVVLQYGRRIVIGAVHAKTGEAITKNLHASLGNRYDHSREWNLTSSGMLMSRAVDKERRMLRVFQTSPNGPVLFSAPLDLDKYGDKFGALIRKVKLQEGTRIEGMIDKSVPRPVMNGTVSVKVVEGVELKNWQARNSWSDWTKIKADGSFVFDSLPRGSVAQMVAVCDGFISARPTNAEIKNVEFDTLLRDFSLTFIYPQVAKLDGARISLTLKMDSTSICRVTVLDSDAKPLEGASVEMYPNQLWFGKGASIVGNGYSVQSVLLLNEDQQKLLGVWENRDKLQDLGVFASGGNRYSVKTNAAGIAEIKTVPGGSEGEPRSGSVYVQHDDYEQPAEGAQALHRRTSVKLTRGKTTEITIKMEKKGTNVLGE